MPKFSSVQAEDLQFLKMLWNYMTLSAFVLWLHDSLITLPTEVRSIWSRKLTGNSMVFILNRYGFLLFEVMLLVPSLSKMSIVGGITDGATKLLAILSVYALFGQKRSLFVLLCLFIVADIIVGSLMWFSYTSVTSSQGTLAEPFTACLAINGDHTIIWSSVQPILQLTFNSIMFILAPYISSVDAARPIPSTIFITASIQASIMLNSVLSSRVMSAKEAQLTVTISSFLNILPNLLINRYVLNIRAYSNRTVQHSGNGPTNITGVFPLGRINFSENPFIGNSMGAPLDPAQWDDVDELRSEVEHGERDSDWEIINRVVDPLTTLVPVIYDHDKGGPITFVPMQREHGPTRSGLL
ncbi:hypothetical protein BDP27DRAFT_1485869 [Rhodocollybia butyracea]|uniref:DUF6533 domain-containing protein n=1 Tax=Rhodocollybia butyracea TaxID=206335 RepID=A0A9P5PB02_9AGAR|nr:hypothetical protein BDP27DRAFT_1485869 [Rhodocollybia butyracea]